MHPQTTLVRRIFWCYAALIFILTHWPKLTVPIPIKRPDLLAHLVVFSTWAVLAGLCAFFGARFSTRNLVVTFIVAIIYAAIDEGLQAIPLLNRTAALDDYMANALGVCIGVGILLLLKTRSKSVSTSN